MIAERLIGPKTNEVPEFQPLLRDLDLAGWVLTMDAGHTVRSHATFISGELLAHFISDRKRQPERPVRAAGCQYAALHDVLLEAARRYAAEVAARSYPDHAHSYS